MMTVFHQEYSDDREAGTKVRRLGSLTIWIREDAVIQAR